MKLDGLCVEPEATEWIRSGAVFLVTDDGMTDGLEMNSNLIGPSGFEIEFEETVIAIGLKDFVVRNGAQAHVGVGTCVDDHVGVLVKVGVDDGTWGGWGALGYGDVGPFEDAFIPVGDQFGLCLATFGKDHDAGGVAIEAVDDVDAFGGIAAFEVGVEKVCGILDVMSGGVHGVEPASFVDGQEVVVLEEDGEQGMVELKADIFGGHDLDEVVGAQGMVEL